MISFVDGPAAGQVVTLKRAPRYLRVTCTRKGREPTWDALDQLGDEPRADEALYAYRLVEGGHPVHLCMSPRRLSGWYVMGKYALVEPQPDDRTMRVTEAWRAWCVALAAAEK